MYRIIGGDQREYGPVSLEQVLKWIEEGRANGETKIKPDGTENWVALGTVPEFIELLARRNAGGAGPAAELKPPRAGISASECLGRDYQLRFGKLFATGWELLMRNFGQLVVACAIVLVLQGVLSILGIIPILGLLFTLCSFVISGPLMGGLFRLMIRVRRGERTEVGNVFDGFRDRFVPLMLAYVVPTLLCMLSVLPGAILAGLAAAMLGWGGGADGPMFVMTVVPLALIAVLPAIYLGVCWSFTIPLVADHDMHFWDAMRLSMGMVKKHWILAFLLLLSLALLYLFGLLLCVIGIFITVPLAFAIYVLAYEEIFG